MLDGDDDDDAAAAVVLSTLQKKARETLKELERENDVEHERPPLRYWADKSRVLVDDGGNDTTSDGRRRCYFQRNGFLHVPKFCSLAECERMKKRMFDLVEKDWHPTTRSNLATNDDDNNNEAASSEQNQQQSLDSFGTGTKENQARGDYF